MRGVKDFLALVSACTWASAAPDHVFVMLPLDIMDSSGNLKDEAKLKGQLDRLKDANVDGVMVDVWWGVTEQSPKTYKFDHYKKVMDMCKAIGFKVQVVTSFHQCGGNTGDTCDIPIPDFVRSHSDIWYKDKAGNEDKEYISLFADNVTVGGRTVLTMYNDWFKAFASEFASYLGSTITEVQVGTGPAGELRYPAYPLKHWTFCGVGQFQCFDDYALQSFKRAAAVAGHPEWDSPPTDAGDYNSRPGDTSFFNNGYQSEYGKFFLDWYFHELKVHGANVLSLARAAFGDDIDIAAKVAGIHWWYKQPHHAAELTAGYYNTNNRDAYAELAETFAQNGKADIDFTCLEMADTEQDASCAPGPEELVGQVFRAGQSKGVRVNGENALQRFDDTAYNKIKSYKNNLHSFTYLRLCDDLLNGDNFNRFKNFVRDMQQGTSQEKSLLPSNKTIVV